MSSDNVECITDEECQDLYDQYCNDMGLNFIVQEHLNVKIGPIMRTFIWLSFIVSAAQAVIILSNRKMR